MTILLGTSGFKGEVPKLSRNKLPPDYAAIARNVKAYSGDLESFAEPLTVDGSEKPATTSSIYLMAPDPDQGAEGEISDVANTTPITITSSTLHGLISGKIVYIDGTGISAIDGKHFAITVTTSAKYTLTGTSASGTATAGLWSKRNGWWLTWTDGVDVDAVKAPYRNDTSSRTIYTGTTVPRVTNAQLVSTGTHQYPEAWYTLGVPSPLTDPTVVVSGTPPADTSQYDSRTYIYTYISTWGEEGAPSPASVVANVGPDQSAVVSGMEGAPAGQYSITHRRVYRYVASSGQFRLVTEVPIATTQITDGNPASALPQTSLVSADWDTPPADLKGVVALANGFMAGYDGHDIYFSEPYQPHAWPLSYRRTLNYKITGLAGFKSTLVAGTQGHPVIMVGSHPGGMVDEEIINHQSCVSKKSMRAAGDAGVVYASPDGLYLVGPSQSISLTENYFERHEWQLFKPTSMQGAIHNGKYFCFYRSGGSQVSIRGRTYPGNGGFWIDPLSPMGVFFIDDNPDDIHVDLLNDAMYFLIGNRIKRWDGSSTLRPYLYRSKVHLLQRPLNFSSARVDASSYENMMIKLYTNDRLKSSKIVTGDAAFRVGGATLDRAMQIEISGTDAVSTVAVAESVSNLAEVG